MAILTPEALLEAGGDVNEALRMRRAEARAMQQETKSLPDWWEFGVSYAPTPGQIQNRRFESPDEFFALGMGYYRKCAESAIIPSYEGLLLHMGFASQPSWYSFAKRHPEYRNAQATLLSCLRVPLEMLLVADGMERSANGAWKRLTNIPDGWEESDDVNVVPLRYSWKDRKQQEVVGLDGAALEVVAGDKTMAELWREMQAAGKKLAPEHVEAEQDEGA